MAVTEYADIQSKSRKRSERRRRLQHRRVGRGCCGPGLDLLVFMEVFTMTELNPFQALVQAVLDLIQNLLDSFGALFGL